MADENSGEPRDVPQNLRDTPEHIGIPDPPVIAKPPGLPFSVLDWMEFQRLCLRVLEMVEGVTDVQMYGVQGQTQNGIDVCGHLMDGSGIAWQVRNVRKFSPTDFRNAVDDFAEGERPLGATTFAVAVSLDLDETGFADELDELGRKYPDLTISLMHGGELSKTLEAQPHIVGRYFGPAWRDAFCDDPAAPAVVVPTPVPSVDELLRGPIEALGLTDQMAEAESAVELNPEAAVQGLRVVAATLSEKGFRGHARAVRRKEAKVLAVAGDVDGALELLCDLLLGDARGGGVSGFSFEMYEARQLVAATADAALKVRLGALEALAGLFESPLEALGDLQESAAELEGQGDALAAEVALWYGEAAMAFRDSRHLADAAERIARLLSFVNDPSLRVRLSLCLAEADGSWQSIVDQARRRAVGPEDAALILRRYGRWLALQGHLEQAETAFAESLPPSIEAHLEGDASEAVFTIRALKLLRGDLSGEIAQIYQLTNLLPGSATYPFPESGSWRDALDSRWRSSLAEAHDKAARVVWKTAVCGHLQSGRDAHELLASVYRDSAEVEAAVHQFIWAGKEDETRDLARRLTEPLDLGEALKGGAPWETVCALKALAWQGHLMDERAVAAVLDRVIDIARQPASVAAPSPGRAAVEALAGMSLSMPGDKVDQVLDVLVPLLERQPGRYRPTDETLVGALLGLYRTHVGRRDQVGGMLLECLQDDLLLGPTARAALESLSPAAFLPLVDEVRGLAASGNRAAAQLLVSHGIDDPAVREEALRRSDWIGTLSPRPNPNEWSGWSGIAEAGVFGRFLPNDAQSVLVERLMAIAEDATELEGNRGSALAGVANLAVVSPALRTEEVFERVLGLCDPGTELSQVDQQNRASLHPRSRFRMNWGVGLLGQRAVVAAATLATTPEQGSKVFELAASGIRGSDENAAAASAHALALLDADLVDFDIERMARHPLPAVRRAAVTVWKNKGFDPIGLGDLFTDDQDEGVRSRLAGAIPSLRAVDSAASEGLAGVLAVDRAPNVRLTLNEPSD